MLVTLVVISLLLPPLVVSAESCNDRCRFRPREPRVECRLYNSGQFRWPTCALTKFRFGPCAVYAGMDVELTCGDSSATVHRVSSQGGLEAEVAGGVLRSVRVEDGGEYVCTDNGGTVLDQRNVFVEGNATLASNDCSASSELYCVDVAQCCREFRKLNILWGSIFAQGSYSLPIGVYGQPAPSPTLSLEWASPHRTLTAADLGMELQKSNESDILYELVVFANDTGYWPETLFYFNGTRVEPMVTGTVIMRAGEEGGTSLPLCYPITFEDISSRNVYLIEPTLPSHMVVEEGQEANFSCRFSIHFSRRASARVRVVWTPPDQPQENCTCSLSDQSNFVCSDCSSLRSVTVTPNTELSTGLTRAFLTLSILVHSAATSDNGSVLTCALETSGERSENGPTNRDQMVVHWMEEARLTVNSNINIFGNLPSPSPSPSSSSTTITASSSSTTLTATPSSRITTVSPSYYAWLPPLLVLLLASGLISLAIVVIMKVKTRRRKEKFHIADVPLDDLCHSNPHHIVEAPPTDPTSDNQSLDSAIGASSDSGQEDSLRDSHLHQAHPSMSSLPEKNADYCIEDTPPTPSSSRSLQVYISYSHGKTAWVLDSLRPLIETACGAAVSVSDSDMVPGHIISEERLRLILAADKMVIVCSTDYAQSPWCQFELYQVLNRQPTLWEGRIIAILCDGCQAPPSVVCAVSTIYSSDEQFSDHLKAALCSSENMDL